MDKNRAIQSRSTLKNYDAHPLGLEINWGKTKIQGSAPNAVNPTSVSVLGNSVELVKSFAYRYLPGGPKKRATLHFPKYLENY